MLRREVLPIRQPKMLPLCASGFALSIVAALLIGHVERTYPARTPAIDVAATHARRAPIVATSEPRSRAEALYRAKRFAEAAALLRAAASSLDRAIARDMRSVAAIYTKLGDTYTRGMDLTLRPAERFEALEQARVLDRVVGGAFQVEIEAAMALVVPKAAIVYAAHKDFDAATRAVRVADSLGVADSSILTVKKVLAQQQHP
jgi:hypothetical protein